MSDAKTWHVRCRQIEKELSAEKDKVDALEADNAALRLKVQELEEWKRIVTGAGTDQESVIRLAAIEYTKTAAENARLREALQLIVHGTQDEAPPWRCLGVTQMQVIARDALQPERGEP